MDQVEEDLKRMKITGCRVKAEDRQVWSRIVGTDQDPPRVVESIEEEE
jgi:hypothetical protein